MTGIGQDYTTEIHFAAYILYIIVNTTLYTKRDRFLYNNQKTKVFRKLTAKEGFFLLLLYNEIR